MTVSFNARKLDCHGRALISCAQLDAALDSGDLNQFNTKLIELTQSILYAEETHSAVDNVNG